jgi:predicted O-methyltransferase YrrM
MTKKLSEIDPSPESYGREHMRDVPTIVEELSEMHPVERAFITGLLMQYKPKKVVELGVSSGAGTVTILNALRGMQGAHLHSVDLFERYYRDNKKMSGWMVADADIPDVTSMWTTYLGKDAVEVMDTIGNGIDFLVLDTAHIHPVETINFICVLPYMNDDAIVVLHDTSLHLQKHGFATASYACGLLFSTVTADKLIPAEKYAPYANIGAFQINSDTRKYVTGLFLSLYLPWGRLYSKPWRELVPQALIKPHAELIERFYGTECRAMFLEAVEAQDHLYKEIPFLTYKRIMIGEFARSFVKRTIKRRKYQGEKRNTNIQ